MILRLLNLHNLMTLLYLLLTCLLFLICLSSSHNSSSEPMSLSLPYCLIKNHMRSCSFPSLLLSVWWLAGLVPYLDEKAESLKAVEVTDGMWIFILFLFLPTTWNDRGMRSVLFLSYLKFIFFLSSLFQSKRDEMYQLGTSWFIWSLSGSPVCNDQTSLVLESKYI